MSKLTLTVDSEVIRQAKTYAASQQQSLSKLVENYLKTLPQPALENEPALELTGIVADLAGIIEGESISDDKSEYRNYLQEKYQ